MGNEIENIILFVKIHEYQNRNIYKYIFLREILNKIIILTISKLINNYMN